MDICLSNLLREELFPGNDSAFRQLQAAIETSRMLVFTGAGTSAPDIPTWSGILRSLIEDAASSGVLNQGEADELKGQVESDPLEVASAIEEAFTKKVFRSKLSSKFQKSNFYNEKHEAVMDLPASAFITLNYDSGLSTAFARRFRSVPEIIEPNDKFQITKWRQEKFDGNFPPIIHWHGKASDPDGIIFTSEDYNKLYSDIDKRQFLQEIWRGRQILAVGFGFTDPFFTRVLEETLRDIDSENRHFSFVGCREKETISTLARLIHEPAALGRAGFDVSVAA